LRFFYTVQGEKPSPPVFHVFHPGYKYMFHVPMS